MCQHVCKRPTQDLHRQPQHLRRQGLLEELLHQGDFLQVKENQVS